MERLSIEVPERTKGGKAQRLLGDDSSSSTTHEGSALTASAATLAAVVAFVGGCGVLAYMVAQGGAGGAGGAAPFAGPSQIATRFGASPATELVVSWAADARCAAASVAFGQSADALDRSVAAALFSYSAPAAFGSNASYASPALFAATLSGLQVSRPVFYRVGADACGGWSATLSASTAPDAGVAGAAFAIIGDLGQTVNSSTTLASILARSAAAPAPFAATLLIGDLSYANGEQALWDSYGELVSPLASAMPLQTLVGNHEWTLDTINASTGQADFRAYIARMHGNGGQDAHALYYSFEVGLVHFVMLQGYCPEMHSTITQPCLRSGGAQVKWLEADLASVDRARTPFVVAAFHQPFVNSNLAHSYDTEGVPMQDAVEDLLYINGVDLVFSGHVHAYERSCRCYQLNCVADGVTYVTIGDGGNHEGLVDTWQWPQPQWSRFRMAMWGHGELTAINSTALHFRWLPNPDARTSLFDEFYITKGAAAGAADTARALAEPGVTVTGGRRV